MRLLLEMWKRLSAESGKYVEYVVSGDGAYVQNVKRLGSFSDDKILLRGKKGAVEIEGKGLTIGKYEGGDVLVRGEIIRISRL